MRALDKAKIERYIATYKLTEHHAFPSSYIGEIFRSVEEIEVDPTIYEGGTRAVTDSVYYLLVGSGITKFNNLKAPKHWHYCDGSPQAVCIIDTKKNTFEEVILGDPILHEEFGKKSGKQIIQALAILPHQWTCAKLIDQESFSLMTCIVTPGFDIRDFRMIEMEEAKKMFPAFQKQISDFLALPSSAVIFNW